MRRAISVIAVAALAILLAVLGASAGDLEPPGPPGPTGRTLEEIFSALQASQSYELVGITNPASPNLGFLGLARKCQAEFGSGVRMCTTLEVMRTVNLPDPANYHAPWGWLQPRIAGGDRVDITGLSVSDDHWNCRNWSIAQQATRGFTVSSQNGDVEGLIFSSPCDLAIAGVACCGPMSQ